MNDNTNASATIDQMQVKFSQNPRLAKANFDIGNYFLNDANDPENALKMHAYNADNCTNLLEAMWSQAAIVWYHVRHKDNDKADAAYAKMLEVFKDQKTLAKECYQIADIYTEVGNTAKARTLHNQVLTDWPESEYVFDARKGLINADFADGKDENALAGIDTLIADYKDKDNMPLTILELGKQYWKQNNKEIDALHAKNIWEKLISKFPDSDFTGEATFMVGEALQALKQYEKAVQSYKTFVNKWPNYDYSWMAQNRIIKIYKRMLTENLMSESEVEAKITESYDALIKQYPDNPVNDKAQEWLNYYKQKKELEKTRLKNSEHIIYFGGSKDTGGTK